MRAFFGTLAGLALLTAVTPAQAQQRTGTSGGGFSGSTGGGFSGSTGGGFSGSTGGGFSGSTGGGFSGSTGGGFSGSSGGGFSGSTGGGFAGSTGGGFSGSTGGGFAGSTGTTGTTGGGRTGGVTGSTQYGATSFLGKHYGNPLSMGMSTGTTTGGTNGSINGGRTNASSTMSFGQPLYNVQNTASVSRTGTTGLTAGGLSTGGTNLGGLNTGGLTGQQGSTAFRGVTTAGIRRAPQYTTQPVFVRATPPLAVSSPGALQAVLSSSTQFPVGSGIAVAGGDGNVTLRGNVGTDREKRIAELMIRMTPGVREVKNELVPTQPPEKAP